MLFHTKNKHAAQNIQEKIKKTNFSLGKVNIAKLLIFSNRKIIIMVKWNGSIIINAKQNVELISLNFNGHHITIIAKWNGCVNIF